GDHMSPHWCACRRGVVARSGLNADWRTADNVVKTLLQKFFMEENPVLFRRNCMYLLDILH
ncbi:hypothetical protein, partial [Pseudoxanthomonas dokdonensis]